MGRMDEIRKIRGEEVPEALVLAFTVFLQFEAPDYDPEDVETFRRDIIENPAFLSSCRQGGALFMQRLTKGK